MLAWRGRGPRGGVSPPKWIRHGLLREVETQAGRQTHRQENFVVSRTDEVQRDALINKYAYQMQSYLAIGGPRGQNNWHTWIQHGLSGVVETVVERCKGKITMWVGKMRFKKKSSGLCRRSEWIKCMCVEHPRLCLAAVALDVTTDPVRWATVVSLHPLRVCTLVFYLILTSGRSSQ